MAKRNSGGKVGIEFYGTSEILKKIEKSSGDVSKAVIKSLEKSVEPIKKDMLEFMSHHILTRETYDSFVNEMNEKKGKIKYNIGFSVRKGGLPAIFLNLGTPFISPTFFIDKSLDNNLENIKKIQTETLKKILKELI